jgi:hypothetical protein
MAYLYRNVTEQINTTLIDKVVNFVYEIRREVRKGALG